MWPDVCPVPTAEIGDQPHMVEDKKVPSWFQKFLPKSQVRNHSLRSTRKNACYGEVVSTDRMGTRQTGERSRGTNSAGIWPILRYSGRHGWRSLRPSPVSTMAGQNPALTYQQKYWFFGKRLCAHIGCWYQWANNFFCHFFWHSKFCFLSTGCICKLHSFTLILQTNCRSYAER